jgi:hypothetical protein
VNKREEMRTGRALRRLIAAAVSVLAVAVIGSPGVAAASSGSKAVSAKKCAKHKRCQARGPIQAPRERAVLLGMDPQDVDLHVYDANGNHSGWSAAAGGVVQGIPNASHSGDRDAAGFESFTDIAFNVGLSNREFSYVICFHGNGPTHAYLTVVDASGATLSTLAPLEGNPGESDVVTPPGGPSTPPPSTVCA